MDRRSASKYSSYTSSSATLVFFAGRESFPRLESLPRFPSISISSTSSTSTPSVFTISAFPVASPRPAPAASWCLHDRSRLSPPRDPINTTRSSTRAMHVGCGPDATLLATRRIEPPRSLTSLRVTSSPWRKLTRAIASSNQAALAHEQSIFHSAFASSQYVGGLSLLAAGKTVP